MLKEDRPNQFVYPIRVFYEDTDAGGVVYYANYLKFMERARSEWLRSLGWDIMKCQSELGLIFVVKSVSLDFVSPARLADELTVTVRLIKLGKIGMSLEQSIYNQDRLICSGLVKLATLDYQPNGEGFVLKRLPAQLRTAVLNVES